MRAKAALVLFCCSLLLIHIPDVIWADGPVSEDVIQERKQIAESGQFLDEGLIGTATGPELAEAMDLAQSNPCGRVGVWSLGRNGGFVSCVSFGTGDIETREPCLKVIYPSSHPASSKTFGLTR